MSSFQLALYCGQLLSLDGLSEVAHERAVLDVLDQRRPVRVRIDSCREQQLQQVLLRWIVAEILCDAPENQATVPSEYS